MSTNDEHVAERLDILNAIMKAIEARTLVVDAIGAAATTDEAKEAIIGLLGVTELGATAILEVQLMRLTLAGRAGIAEAIEQLSAQI